MNRNAWDTMRARTAAVIDGLLAGQIDGQMRDDAIDRLGGITSDYAYQQSRDEEFDDKCAFYDRMMVALAPIPNFRPEDCHEFAVEAVGLREQFINKRKDEAK